METIGFICQLCGATLEAPASASGDRMVCPTCDGLVVVPGRSAPKPPSPAEPQGTARPSASRPAASPPTPPVKPLEYPERRHRLATTAAWGASLALHALLLLSFTGLTWLSGLGTGADGLEVDIAGVAEGQTIHAGDARLEPIRAPAATPDALQVSEPVKVEPITDIGGAARQNAEAILGIEMGAGGSATAMKGDWSAFVASGGGSGGGGASFFGLEARGKKFVYIVDRSSSMSGAKFQAAKSELVRSISALRRHMHFFIIFYNHEHEPMPADGLVKATEQNKRRYLTWVDQVGSTGGTDPTEAMRRALSLKPDAVWLLSDGLFADRAADAIRAANPGARIQVHTIAFYDDAGERILRRIAEENRGHYRFVPPAALGLGARRRWPRRP